MRSILLAFTAAWLLAVAAQAAEHITLSNGFELNCDHRGAADSSRPADASGSSEPASAPSPAKVRLYLDASDANYIDVAPDAIVNAETLPTPPPVASALSTAKPPAAPVNPAQINPAQINPAQTDLSAADLRRLLAEAGAAHDLDIDLLASVVDAESGSHPRAVSHAGAQGLMQLIPSTAAQFGVKDSFAPEANVHGGTAYLDSLLKRYHDNLALALAAYNAGPGAVDRYHGIPPYRETRAYVARIIHEFNRRYSARQATGSLAANR